MAEETDDGCTMIAPEMALLALARYTADSERTSCTSH